MNRLLNIALLVLASTQMLGQDCTPPEGIEGLNLFPSYAEGRLIYVAPDEPMDETFWFSTPLSLDAHFDVPTPNSVNGVSVVEVAFREHLYGPAIDLGLEVAISNDPEASDPLEFAPGEVFCGAITGTPIQQGQFLLTVDVSVSTSPSSAQWTGRLVLAPLRVHPIDCLITGPVCNDLQACNYVDAPCGNAFCVFPTDRWSGSYAVNENLNVVESILVEAPVGAVISAADPVTSIRVNMEHSYAGDIEMWVECPNGQSALLLEFPNDIGNVSFGQAIDLSGDNSEAGIPFCYQFVDEPGAFPTLHNASEIQLSTSVLPTLPAGTYQAEAGFEGLEGCPIAGEWQLVITDNIGSDDGWFFGWQISLPQSISAECYEDFCSGCTDPLACNFDPFATEDAGNCEYGDSSEIRMWLDGNEDGINSSNWNPEDRRDGLNGSMYIHELDVLVIADHDGSIFLPGHIPPGDYTVTFASLDGTLEYFDGEPVSFTIPFCGVIDVVADLVTFDQLDAVEFVEDRAAIPCEGPQRIEMTVVNEGTTLCTGTASMQFDPSFDYEGFGPLFPDENPGIIEWEIDELIPSERMNIGIFLDPLDPSMYEELLTVHRQLDLVCSQGTTYTIDDSVQVLVHCDLDGLTKTAAPPGFGENHAIEAGETIRYRITFDQLLGATRQSVRIEEWLDAALFDLETYQFVRSSTPCVQQIYPGGRFAFSFENYSVWWANENDTSQGYVEFEIQLRADLPAGTVIENSAILFIDDLTPLTTNVYTHTVQGCSAELYPSVVDIPCGDPIVLPEAPLSSDQLEISLGAEILASGSGPFTLDVADVGFGESTLNVQLVSPVCAVNSDLQLIVNALVGDFDLDGVVSSSDLLVVLGEYGCIVDCQADFDRDATVGVGDLLVVLGNYGEMCP